MNSGEISADSSLELPPYGLFWSDLVAVVGEIPLESFLSATSGSFLLELPDPDVFQAPPFKPGQALHRLMGLGTTDLGDLRVHHLSGRSVLQVGRDHESGVIIMDDSVSVAHAQIRLVGESWQVADSNSTNGTHLETTRLPSEAWGPLESGRIVKFGFYRCVFLAPADLHALASGKLPVPEPREGGVVSPPEGFRLRELVRAVGGWSRDEFLNRCHAYWLLQVPLETPEGVTPAEEFPVGATRALSESRILGLRRSKKLGDARVHSLVPGKPLSVGRTPPCDVLIGEKTVSKQHAELRLTPRGWRLIDHGSQNGSFLDGAPVDPHEEIPLRPGQILSFSSYRALLLAPEQLYEMIDQVNRKTTRRAKRGMGSH